MTTAAATLLVSIVAFVSAAALGAPPHRRPVRRPPLPEARSGPRRRTSRMTRRLWSTPKGVKPAALASWSDDLSRALRHGSTLRAALSNTLPTDTVIAQRSASLRHWLDRGASVADACDEWADDLVASATEKKQRSNRIELLVAMSAVLAATASLGGSAAAPLDRFAVTMRQRASDDLERAAHSAQAKMSARVLTSVPIAVLALLVATDGDVRSVIASTAGAATVSLGLVVNTIGAVWMRRVAQGNNGVRPC